MQSATANYIVAALYQFVDLPHFAALRDGLYAVCLDAGTSGTLLLASEGINGTIAGNRAGIDRVLSYIREEMGLTDLEHKESFAETNPFNRMKVRLKREIVTMGVDGIDPKKVVGTYVAPEDWNRLIEDPDTILIDTRNDYEVGIGSFKGAEDPGIKTFREFPDWFKSRMAEDPEGLKNKKVAMFCTGGIRCEKSTAFARQMGLENVYHLKGGILKYLEFIAPEESRWEGECFVFDERTSVKQGLEPGSFELCRACRNPLDAASKLSELYEEGVSCPNCHTSTSEDRRTRYRERQHQFELSRKRGVRHIGSR